MSGSTDDLEFADTVYANHVLSAALAVSFVSNAYGLLVAARVFGPKFAKSDMHDALLDSDDSDGSDSEADGGGEPGRSIEMVALPSGAEQVDMDAILNQKL